MDARFMQMHNFVLTREIIINSIFPVDRMRELNFHRETAVRGKSSMLYENLSLDLETLLKSSPFGIIYSDAYNIKILHLFINYYLFMIRKFP